MKIKLGDIYIANLNPVKGHEQSGLRPVIVIQKTYLNNILPTIVILPITSQPKARGKLLTVILPKKEGGVKLDSVILSFQIKTIDKSRLIKKIGNVKDDILIQLRRQVSLGLF